MRAASALFLRAENGPQQPPQNPRRLPDNDPHAPPLLSSQARSAAGNQEPGHQKHQRSHRKDGRDEDPCPQRQGAHTDQRPTVPSSHPHPSSATVYAGGSSPDKRAMPFCQASFRSDPRIFVCYAHKNTLSTRKVFFATYTPPQKTDWIFFAAFKPRTL